MATGSELWGLLGVAAVLAIGFWLLSRPTVTPQMHAARRVGLLGIHQARCNDTEKWEWWVLQLSFDRSYANIDRENAAFLAYWVRLADALSPDMLSAVGPPLGVRFEREVLRGFQPSEQADVHFSTFVQTVCDPRELPRRVRAISVMGEGPSEYSRAYSQELEERFPDQRRSSLGARRAESADS